MMLISVWKKIPKKALWALLALGAALLLFLPRSGSGRGEAAAPEESFSFSLSGEEARIAAALARVPGAGKVTVVLTLDSSEEREYARNTDSDAQSGTGTERSELKSQVAEVGDAALTVRVAYPRDRGALVVTQGSGSGLKLEITQAVMSLTGLSSDRITVVTGAQ